MHIEVERELVLLNYSPPAAWFHKSSFIGTQPGLFVYVLTMVAFVLQRQSTCDRDCMALKASNSHYLTLHNWGGT